MGAVTQSAHPDPLPREQLRASDADRQSVVDKLHRAHDDGRLTLAEYDERVKAAYSARTYADLLLLTADLPDAIRPPAVVSPGIPVGAPATTPARPARDIGGTVWRIVGSTWFGVSLINLLIWGIIGLAGNWVYPWWIWVAGPWGAVLLVGWLSGFGRRRDG
jgi:hypothetical protein